ncbi:CopK family periplasmic copper-binding protein [Denitromonas halophila]|nr:CopK family periplasmic copper-binding protein [Denitromonas halophila]
MKNAILIATLTGLVSTSALALGTTGLEKSVPLADGQTVHIFENGKMGMEGRYGQPVFMASGASMKAADGRVITMVGNETARVGSLLQTTP